VSDKLYYIDNASGLVKYTWGISSYSTYVFDAIPCGYAWNKANHLSNLPVSGDPLWGTGGSLEWAVVPKNGYFLPKRKYHQIELVLRNDTRVDDIILAPTVKIPSLQPGGSKFLYVKTDIPDTAQVTDYTTRLKTWWDER